MYYMFKAHYNSQHEAAEQALEFARKATENFGNLDEGTFEKWSLEMFKKYKIGAEISKTNIMRLINGKSWFSPQMISGGFYWTRYRQYLTKIKGWPIESVQAID